MYAAFVKDTFLQKAVFVYNNSKKGIISRFLK